MQLPPSRKVGAFPSYAQHRIIDAMYHKFFETADMFIKPRHTQPTRFLFVGNCGTALGLKEETIRSFFSHLGAVNVIFPDEKKRCSHIFVTFGNESTAEAALSYINGKPIQELGNRVLAAKYSDVKPEKVISYSREWIFLLDMYVSSASATDIISLFRRWRRGWYSWTQLAAPFLAWIYTSTS